MEVLHSSETPLELQVNLSEFKHTCTEMLISCSIVLTVDTCTSSVPHMYAVFLFFQVTESHLRKRMEEVKELFTETSDVFRELVAAKAQVTARMTECMASIQSIKDVLSTHPASEDPQLIQDIQVNIQAEMLDENKQ